MRYIRIEANREGYAPNQIDGTMTVRELIEKLQEFDNDLPVILSNDNGYTFGAIYESGIRYETHNEKGEE